MIISWKQGLLIALAAANATVLGQPAKNPTDKPVAVHSTFVMPSNPQEGRDPFYPESIRPYANAMASHVAPITTLAIKGFSGTPENRMVIINNHSFGVGDEGDVLTPGGRVHVHCLEINADSVVIEANNQRRTLNFSTQ
jgi:hypothetical protein